jgi:phosphoserine aminotransferase
MKYNFSAGPSVLPREVLEQCRDQMLDYNGQGISVMEMSHRSKEFVEISEKAKSDLREFLSIPDNFEILFCQGGATM